MNPEDRERVEKRTQSDAMRQLRATWFLEEFSLMAPEGTMQITEIRVRMPLMAGGEYLTIVKAVANDVQYVGFHSASSSQDAIAGALERVKHNSLKWREDEPYDPKSKK